MFKAFYVPATQGVIREFLNSCVRSVHKLSESDLKIVKLHSEAVKAKQDFYTDPETGYLVLTRLKHLERNKCCGSACRHCPFDQVNVKDSLLRKKYNGFFYQ